MHKTGWFRLWVLLTVLGVPSATLWAAHQEQRGWDEIDKRAIHACVDAQWYHPALDGVAAIRECDAKAGVTKTFFEREETTPLRYWSSGLGLMFVADLVITAVVVGFFLAVRWVVRGFRPAISQ